MSHDSLEPFPQIQRHRDTDTQTTAKPIQPLAWIWGRGILGIWYFENEKSKRPHLFDQTCSTRQICFPRPHVPMYSSTSYVPPPPDSSTPTPTPFLHSPPPPPPNPVAWETKRGYVPWETKGGCLKEGAPLATEGTVGG